MILSEEELEVLKNHDFFDKKSIITNKIIEELEGLKPLFKKNFDSLPKKHVVKHYLGNYPKISKGENYHNLPYFILDYPRVFKKDETFAIRSMVLWGKFFSFTLHISGGLQKNIIKNIITHRSSLSEWFICVNDNPWEYLYEDHNYLLINNLESDKLRSTFKNKPFLKLSVKHEIMDYQLIQYHADNFLKKIIPLLE